MKWCVRSCLLIAMILLTTVTGGLRAQELEQAPAEEQVADEPEEIPSDFENAGFTATDEPATQEWQGELDLIADLLIDGNAAEAKARAEDLLEVENLSPEVAARAQSLREKAEARLAEPPADSHPRPKIEIPAKNEDGGKTESAEEKPRVQSFSIRVAVVGGGFRQGASGILRVSESGLTFTRKGQARAEWSIPWKQLAEARSDDGLWDAPYPLVLVERGGGRRYIAHIDQKGRYLSGRSLLAALSKDRRPGAGGL